jgi:uncharacterized protein (TIGR02246 family)
MIAVDRQGGVMVRRVVTGHTEDGRPAVLSDEELPDLRMDLFPGCTFRPLWGTDAVPATSDPTGPPRTWFPPVGGVRVALSGIDAFPPTLPEDLDMDAARRQAVATIPDMLAPFDPDGSGRHRTDTVDVVIVVEGAVVLELDDGTKTALHAGDVVVQQGTGHTWHPQPGAPMRLVSVLVGAQIAAPQTPVGGDLAKVADELAIRNLIARVAQLTDDGDPDDYAQCFTEDATWEIPGAPRRGRDDIRTGLLDRRAIKACGPGTESRHMITTSSVRVLGADTAAAASTWMFCTELRTGPIVRATGVYADDLVRTDEGWRVLHRRIILDTTG